MRQVASGDSAACRRLAMQFGPRVHRIQRGLLDDPQDADDATQETLIELLHSAGSFRAEASLARWIERIAIRTGLRHRRRQRRHQPSLVLEPDEFASASTPTRAQDELPRPLLSYLRELSDPERQALFLKHALGFSVREVAAMTETTVSTTKYRLSTALQRVRRAIRRDVALGIRAGVSHDR